MFPLTVLERRGCFGRVNNELSRCRAAPEKIMTHPVLFGAHIYIRCVAERG